MPGGRDAGRGELVVEPCGGPAAEVGADRVMERRQYLKQHEHRPGQGQRQDERIAALDRANQHAHGDCEQRRQKSAKQQRQPPCDGERKIGLRQNAQEFPFLARPQLLDHERPLLRGLLALASRASRRCKSTESSMARASRVNASARARSLARCS